MEGSLGQGLDEVERKAEKSKNEHEFNITLLQIFFSSLLQPLFSPPTFNKVQLSGIFF